jgi:hypothetical protein
MGSSLATYNRRLTAGVTQVINVQGNLFHLRSAASSVAISFGESSSDTLTLSAGGKAKIEGGFKRVFMKSSSTIDIVVNIGTGDIDDVSDSANVASALSSVAVSVGTSATLLKAANTGRKNIIIQALDRDIYIGDSGVTTANGIHVLAGGSAKLAVQSAVYGIAIGVTDTRIMELA